MLLHLPLTPSREAKSNGVARRGRTKWAVKDKIQRRRTRRRRQQHKWNIFVNSKELCEKLCRWLWTSEPWGISTNPQERSWHRWECPHHTATGGSEASGHSGLWARPPGVLRDSSPPPGPQGFFHSSLHALQMLSFSRKLLDGKSPELYFITRISTFFM